ncbi:hypothetical protein RsTz2092_03810 [Deferribacterales bacterium RsTz2092]|nr:hypothetical protein AGMMS49941_02390 [Deferribacterales bacterium]
MSEFVFVNPSPNLELIACELEAYGREVSRVWTLEMLRARPANVWAFVGQKYSRLNGHLAKDKLDGNVTNLKKPFFASFKYRYVRQKLININPEVANGSFQDYILLTGEIWNDTKSNPPAFSKQTIDGVIAQYPDSIIITSQLPAYSGKRVVSMWESDYDVLDALGDDYYMFFEGNTRHELLCLEGKLRCVSDSASLDWLARLNPTMKRFKFENISSYSFIQNTNAWLDKYSSSIFIVNDYSWLNFAVRMPDSWARDVSSFFFNYKQSKDKKG